MSNLMKINAVCKFSYFRLLVPWCGTTQDVLYVYNESFEWTVLFIHFSLIWIYAVCDCHFCRLVFDNLIITCSLNGNCF